ncbi:uncharacterized protein LOC123557295 [Mercenaria mercenaria]|uniref:uncharacterized protein LOC123557295 n=1 Tax=Mercenaria mercenaria TaxID=6596 RepID=UPI00234EDA71|nr:uncharacterized protein LOC123557295 [Mercenaria mercenaria]
MEDVETLTLEKVDHINIVEYTPAIVVMTLIVVCGLTGNIFAAIFYIRKAQQSVLHIFISCLSVNDAVTNFVLVHDIFQLFFYLSSKDVITCKLFLVLKHWLIGNSLLFMVAMAADRYRRICYPFSKQITYQVARFIILGLTSFSFLIASRNIATADIFKFNITAESNSAITGYYCTRSKEKEFALAITIFHVIDICIHGITMVLFVTLNVFLIRKIFHTKQKLKIHGPSVSFKVNGLQSESSVCVSSTDKVHIDFDNNGDNIGDTVKKKQENKYDIVELEKKSTVKTGTLKNNHGTLRRTLSRVHASRMEIKITVMVVVITVISALCFVPYYVAMLTVKQDFSGSSRIMSVAEILARRSYILNSAVNPFVMLLFNLPFRHFVQNVVCFKCLQYRNMGNM